MSSFKPSKISENIFANIKADLLRDMSDKYIKEMYGIGQSTFRLIKKCRSYNDYKNYHAMRLVKRKSQKEVVNHLRSTFDSELLNELRNRVDLQSVLLRQANCSIAKQRIAIRSALVAIGIIIFYLVVNLLGGMR